MKSLRLSTILTRCLIAAPVLLSCTDHDISSETPLPKRAIHYNFETGQKLGERTYTYDDQQQLVVDLFDDISTSYTDHEIKYEYDADGNVSRKLKRSNSTEEYLVTEYEYENGLKKSESTTYDGVPLGYKTLSFYTDGALDSTQTYYYEQFEQEYRYLFTTVYEIDRAGNITRAYDKVNLGVTIYRYKDGQLTETCNVLKNGLGEDVEDCIINEYDAQGRIVRVLAQSPWRNEVQEELFYRGKRLDEKKLYYYPFYDAGNGVHITQVLYEYE